MSEKEIPKQEKKEQIDISIDNSIEENIEAIEHCTHDESGVVDGKKLPAILTFIRCLRKLPTKSRNKIFKAGQNCKQNKKKKEGQPDKNNLSHIDKPTSKIKTIFFKTGKGMKKSAKAAVRTSKAAYTKCRYYLKKKGIIGAIKQHKIISFFFAGIFLLIIIILMVVAFSGHRHGPNAVSNLLKINSIQSELGTLQNTITTTSQMNDQQRQSIVTKLQLINAKLNNISHENGIKRSKQVANLQATLRSNSISLSLKIVALNHEINRLKAKVFPASTLSAKALPFKVVSVDPWNGQPYAQIVQKNNGTMISYVGLYQTVGGWKIININAPEQTVSFINAQNQIVNIKVKQF